MCRPEEKGFTLLELLIALSVFALVSAISYAGLRSVLVAEHRTEAYAERLQQLQSAVMMLERDLSQAVNRPIRDQFGDSRVAFYVNAGDKFQLEFTRAGLVNPLGIKRSTLQRVAFGVTDNALVRYSWSALDRPQGSEPLSVVLLDDVRRMDVRLMNQDKAWQSGWQGKGSADSADMGLPLAIEVTLEMDTPGDIRRVFVLPANSTVQPPGEEKSE
jgi:general secretion pathway protein J